MNVNRTLVCSGFAGIAVVLIAGCTSTAKQAAEEATESSTRLRPDLGGSLEIDVEVGDCILASGNLDDAAALRAVPRRGLGDR